ncbi:MAG: terminase large subunit domain-containing protein [Cetobacterium sp.]|uniref:terminase large subunit domain-containing protein n=1 Tax=Cetobacterium sp. TaxID=2071632 RepID=UPI003EE44C36
MSQVVNSLVSELQALARLGDTEGVARLIDQVEAYKQYNQIYFWHPYQYQLEFMNASKSFKQRYARSGNRVGKTKGASFEVAYHLTGLYPDWFEGDRIKGSGHTFWCIGIDNDSTTKVMQKELFGTSDIRVDSEVGTGSIPRDLILLEEGITKDGPRVVSCRIKHTSGGYNTLMFYAASNGSAKLMGQATKFIWMDEIPEHHGMDIYSQCWTRCATTDGHLMLTATPEAGMCDVNRLYAEDKTGKLYLQSISMYQAPHLTTEKIEELKSGWPEYQHEMRVYGLPVLGSGAVFPFPDSLIVCEDVVPKPTWDIIVGLDFSSVSDASVVAWVTYDPDEEMYYLFHVDYITEMTNKNEEYMANLILNSEWPWAPTISPHDGGVNSTNPESKAKVMKRMGVNIQSRSFYNPQELGLSFKNKSTIAREPGLTEMRRLFKAGKLKVCKSVRSFFDEKNQLFYAPVSGGGIKYVGKDDCIDAARYAVISMIGNRGLPVCQCISEPIDFNNGFINSEANQVSWER